MSVMRRGSISAACALGAVLFWSSICSLNSQTDAQWTWSSEHFSSVLDALMPLQRRSGMYVSYRANRDYATNTPEYWFMIGHEPREKGYGLNPYLSAHVGLADPVSIYDQLMAIHGKDPTIQGAKLILDRIKLRKFDFTEMNCPAMKEQLERLKNLPVKLPDINGGEITLHPMIHALYITGAEGDAHLVLTDDKNGLVQWAQETRSVLDSCGKVR